MPDQLLFMPLKTMLVKSVMRVVSALIVFALWAASSSCGSTSTENDECIPTDCGEMGHVCGSWEDGCGGDLDCGTCDPGYSCITGACVPDDCKPLQCTDIGAECGTYPDNCDGSIFCGDCPQGYHCDEGLCVPNYEPSDGPLLFGFSKAMLDDPIALQQRGFDALEVISQAARDNADFSTLLMQERVRTLDDYFGDPLPFLVSSDLVIEQINYFTEIFSNEEILVVYSHSHGIETIPGTRMGGMVLDDPADTNEPPGVLRWPQYADAVLDVPAETVVILTMSCFSGGFVNFLENHEPTRDRWENRASEGRDFVVITSQNAHRLSSPRLIEGTMINPLTYSVHKAFEGYADGYARDDTTNEPDGEVTLQELIEYIVDETESHTSENDADNDPEPQFTGSYRQEKVVFTLTE